MAVVWFLKHPGGIVPQWLRVLEKTYILQAAWACFTTPARHHPFPLLDTCHTLYSLSLLSTMHTILLPTLYTPCL